MKWISIKEKLPYLGSQVLALRSDGVVRVTYFYNIGIINPRPKAYRFYENESNNLEITHWMPLPDPPNKDA